MTLSALIDQSTPYVIAAVAAAVTYFLGRKKTKAEVSAIEASAASTELHNVETAISIYRKLAEDLSKQIVDLKGDLKKVTDQLYNVEAQNKTLIGENRQLKGQLQSLENKINEMQSH